MGAPIEIDENLYIGAYILMPTGEIKIYTKQFLHAGEEQYYASSFAYNPRIKIKEELISFAICADIDYEQHPFQAKENNCSLYVASIFFTENGINQGQELLTQYSKHFSFKILMSNYVGKLWKMKAGGKSGFWDEDGKLIGVLDSKNEGLLIIEKKKGLWKRIWI